MKQDLSKPSRTPLSETKIKPEFNRKHTQRETNENSNVENLSRRKEKLKENLGEKGSYTVTGTSPFSSTRIPEILRTWQKLSPTLHLGEQYPVQNQTISAISPNI